MDTAAAAGGGKDEDPWVTILRDRPLMEDPHHEDDAQYWHVVTADEFDRELFDPESAAPLRSVSMYCSQALVDSVNTPKRNAPKPLGPRSNGTDGYHRTPKRIT